MMFVQYWLVANSTHIHIMHGSPAYTSIQVHFYSLNSLYEN